MPYYKLESDYGWTELLNLIYVLNNDTASISEVINVNQTLWMHAFNYTLLNLDSYIAYAHNYYLYMDDNNIFNPIIWDLNMSFGSFRHSDGSLNFSGLSIDEMGGIDPLQHLEFSISPRPLMKNLFLNSTYKKMYLAHIRTIMEEEILSGNYMQDAEYLHEIIEPHVIADTNKFYSDEDFQNNLYTQVGESTELYPGLEEIMTARTDYLLTYTGMTGEPDYGNKTISRDYTYPGDEIEFFIEVENADKVYLYYRFYKSNQFKAMLMTDDGSGADTVSGDNVYSVSLLTEGDIVQYYFWAENDSAGAFLPKKAAGDYFDIVCYKKQEVLINEIKYLDENFPSNFIGFDWVELYNPSDNDIDIVDYKLYYNNTLYLLDDTQIPPYGHLTLSITDFYFVDSTCFSELEDYLILTSYNNIIIDSLNIIPCNTLSSYGPYPDGATEIQILNPTFGTSNKLFGNGLADLHIYPNPCADEVNLELNSDFQVNEIRICNHLGSTIYYINDLSKILIENNEKFSLSLNLNISNWSNGIYYIRYIGNKQEYSAKFVKIK